MNLLLIVLLAGSHFGHQDSINEIEGIVLAGHHRTLSSSTGFDGFKTTNARTLFRIDNIKDGKVTGLMSTLGLNWQQSEPKHLVRDAVDVVSFSGQFKDDIICITYAKDGDYPDGRTYRTTTTMHGHYEDERLAGYFTTEWKFSDGVLTTLGGTFDLVVNKTQ